MELHSYDVTKSYMDMARSVTTTSLVIDEQLKGNTKFRNDAFFSLVSCSYIYSYLAITSFVSVHMYEAWTTPNSKLSSEFAQYGSFESMMRKNFGDVKSGLKKLCELVGIENHHKKQPSNWNDFASFLKTYRDFFVHPTPDKFGDVVNGAFSKPWSFAPDTAESIIGYFYDELGQKRPDWLTGKGNLVVPEFRVEPI